jgi:hypothetical protein
MKIIAISSIEKQNLKMNYQIENGEVGCEEKLLMLKTIKNKYNPLVA